MLRARRWISDKDLFVVGSGIPKDFRDVPRPIAIVDDQTVSLSLEFAMGAKQGVRRCLLQERPCLSVYGGTQKIVRGRVADVELNCGIELDQLHQIGFEEGSGLGWRLGLERISPQLLHRTQGRDTETDLLSEPELQQDKKENTKTKVKLSQEIHMTHSRPKRFRTRY